MSKKLSTMPVNKKTGYSKLFSCAGKVCVVTGGLGFLGREVVKGLSDFGGVVYAADTVEASKKSGARNKFFIPMDISSEESLREGLSAIFSKEKKIDVLVNCAYPRTKDWGDLLEKVSFSSWNENVESHLGGYFLSCRAAAEIMKENKAGGAIINFASIYGMVAPDFGVYTGTAMTMPAAYAAIKGGIINFSKYLAAYYAGFNIRVNTVSPGGVFNGQPEKFVENYVRNTPLGRMAQPEDIVGAVVYLASGASGYVTGANLVVDGGWTIK